MEENLAKLDIKDNSSPGEAEDPGAAPETPPPEEAQPNAKLYEYEPLETGSIRLLFLLEADEDDDDLECALLHFELSEVTEYTALSYVWGDESNPCAIYIGDEYLPITPNLEDALRHLRRRDQPVWLWVDALCIDQAHTEERNHQVQQMRQIYESAAQTVVYLGGQTGGNTGYSAWNFLERNSIWALNQYREKDYTLPADIEDQVDFRGELYDVYLDVLSRPWFSRVWVFQEVVVSKDVMIQCGPRGVSWDDFCKLVILQKRAHDRYGLSLQQQDLSDSLRRIWQARVAFHLTKGQEHCLPDWYIQTLSSNDATTDILDMLVRARHLMASDPRDKIFALLGISTGFNWRNLDTINYANPTSSVYAKFAVDLMTSRNDYRPLSYLNRSSTVDYLIELQRLWLAEYDYWQDIISDEKPFSVQEAGLAERDPVLEMTLLEECRIQEERLSPETYKYRDHEPVRLPSWVPTWHCIHMSTFEPRAIIEVVEKQQSSSSVEAIDHRALLSTGAFAVHGRVIGELHEAISPASVLGNDELAFEELKRRWRQSSVYQKHPLEGQILTLWAHMLDMTGVKRLYVPRGVRVNMIHQSPELRRREDYDVDDILNHPPGSPGKSSTTSSFLNFLDFETCPPKPGSIEAHLVSRARKTAEWSDSSQPTLKRVNDPESIIDQRAIGVYIPRDTVYTPETPKSRLVLLPSSARFGDLIVYFPGAKVPFLVRPNMYSPLRVAEIRNLIPSGALPFLKDEEMYTGCELIGECWINDFEEIASKSKPDCVFGLL
ncbi:hypothetical protein CEP54_015662 [Fusarium duplospermum]|uniref:Heterokaryon incompatibility domain-containing protein n=1 Tax=Fusarium duplospermum TaxID=1325734 RepID=A0A428NMC5_9HYPO|nr:hypothetical protein CEP54_015662 [Fusarium duplospermum]